MDTKINIIGVGLAFLTLIVSIYMLAVSGWLGINYNRAVKSGDAYFSEKEFHKAKDFYVKCLEVKPEDSYCKSQMKECNNKIDLEKLLTKADNYYNSDKYEEALKTYKEALLLDSKNKYCESKIDKCREAIKKIKATDTSSVDPLCTSLRNRADSISTVINEKIKKIKGQSRSEKRLKINHLFWKEELEKISRYDCIELNKNIDEVMQSFVKAENHLSE